MRCLALAQAWQDAGGHAVFAVADLPAPLEKKLRVEGAQLVRVTATPGSIEDAKSTIQAASELSADWVVVDGDRFNVNFLFAVQSAGPRVLLIDDFASREAFPSDLVVNPNLGATEERYRRQGFSGPLLLGECYVLLRREFICRNRSLEFPEMGTKVLVAMGGSDPENLAPRIVESLRCVQGLQVTLVVGVAYPQVEELQRLDVPNLRIVFNASNMQELMEWADLAIIAAGGTLWELLYMGCAVLSYSRNWVQASVVQELAQMGAVRNLGETEAFEGARLATAVRDLVHSRQLRMQMANTGRHLVDGKGSDRVLRAMREKPRGV